MLKPQRVFRNHYICDACETEFADEMLVVSSSFCPACDAEIEPYSSEDMFDV
jgi:rRNA maturation endonuclease Nob1